MVAAVLLATAVPALASPGLEVGAGVSVGAGRGRVGAGIEVGADLGLVKFDAGVAAGGQLELCGHHAGLELDYKVKANCQFFGSRFHERMNTKAHLTYETALSLYYDIMCVMRHTLMTRGLERMKRLIEISAMVRDAENILINAEIYNAIDARPIRRGWVAHEIKHLRGKLETARWISLHLPNLCLAEDVFNFVVDASITVVKGALAIPVIAGAAVVASIQFAAHLAARAFHFMGRVLKWAVEEIEYAFLVFRAKVRAGLHAIGEGLHRFGHALKEGAEDVAWIISDKIHHAFQHHSCHCPKTSAVIVVGGEDDCSCSGEEEVAAVSLTKMCVVQEQVCTEKQFTAKLHAEYDMELKWSETTAVTQVTETVTKINAALGGLSGELRMIEADANRANLEAEA